MRCILRHIWHHKQPQSGTKVNIDRLMLVRWWLNCARFIKKAGCSVFLCGVGITNSGVRQAMALICPNANSTYKHITRSCQINRTQPRPLAYFKDHCLQWKDPDLPCVGFKEKGGVVAEIF